MIYNPNKLSVCGLEGNHEKTYQVGNRNENIIENALAEERLDESAAGSSAVAPDVDSL